MRSFMIYAKCLSFLPATAKILYEAIDLPTTLEDAAMMMTPQWLQSSHWFLAEIP